MSDILVGWFLWRVKNNKNAIAVLNGQTGSGKSWAGLSLCEKGSKWNGTNFTIKENVAFDFKTLLKQTHLEKNSKPGTFFLFEEVGAFGSGSASREWQSQANKFFHSFLQTTRHRRQILIFTCPMFTNLEAGARALCHMQMIMKKIHYKDNKSQLVPYVIQINQRTGKMYFKLLRFHEPDVPYRQKLTSTFVEKPSEELIKEYEKVKLRFTTQLNKTIMEEMKPKKKVSKGINVDAVCKLKEAGTKTKEIAEIFGVTRRYIRMTINKAKNKQIS